MMKRIRDNTNSVNTMKGFEGDTKIISITAKQYDILASFLPMNKSVPQCAISNMRAIMNKLYELALNEYNDELTQNQIGNLKTFVPLLCNQVCYKVSQKEYMLKLRNIFSRLQMNDLGSFKVSESEQRSPLTSKLVKGVCTKKLTETQEI